MGYYPDLKDRPLVFIDVETTGLDPLKHEMLEVGAVVAHPDVDVVDVFSAKIKPMRIESAHPRALEVNGYTEEAWADAKPLFEVLPSFLAFVKGAVIGGHNVRFDAGFVNAAVAQLGLDLRIDYHLVDTCTLAYEHLVPHGLKSMSLANVCKFIGIPPEDATHRALAGAQKSMDVYRALTRATDEDRLGWGLKGG